MANSICINNAERDALRGLPDKAKLIYLLGIRPYMDYGTGMVGLKRKISWQSIAEELYIENIRGVSKSETGKPSEQQLRRAIKHLEKAGLIECKSTGRQLIFYCNLALQDKSVKIKADSKNRVIPTAQTPIKPTSENYPTIPINIELELLNNDVSRQVENDLGRHQKIVQADTPPVKDNINKKEIKKEKEKSERKCSLPHDFCVKQIHLDNAEKNNWPSPHDEIEAFKDWHAAKGNKFLDWDRAFYTWLRNSKRFSNGRKLNEIHQRTRETNTKSNSITRSVNAYIRKKQGIS